MRSSLRAIKTWPRRGRTPNMTLSIRKKTMNSKEPKWSRNENKLKHRIASAMRKDWSRRKVECTISLMLLRVVRCKVCGVCDHQTRQTYGVTIFRWINMRTWNAIKKSIANTKRNWLMAYSRKSRSISESRGSQSMLANNICFHSRCSIIEFEDA